MDRMDTASPDPRIPSSPHMTPSPSPCADGAGLPTSIDADTLRRLAGSARWPQVLDVRRAPAHDASPLRIAGALRCAPGQVSDAPAWLDPARDVVCVCVHGHEVSRDAAAALRGYGFRARMLVGGIEAWRAAGGAIRRADATLQVPPIGGSTWVTRSRPKVDRGACPWLVRRFVDPRARFVHLPEGEVLEFAARTGAIAFDLPGGAITHDGERCSFDTLCEAAGLQDEALSRLAVIVRGADTDRHALAPEASGLMALSLGLSRLHEADDAAMLEAALPMYDALYAWCREARHESHRWQPEATR
jgi:rhodanese-related sulfurtransferase